MTASTPAIVRFTGESRGGRFASIEGYRALAALTVLFFHVWLVSWPPGNTYAAALVGNLGDYGVAVFFVISGFVLFRTGSAAVFAGGAAPSSGRFLIRRFLRIYPAFWVAITAWALVADEAQRAATSPVKVFLLIDADEGSLGLAWTLRLEVMFYLVLAALVPLLVRATRNAVDQVQRLRAQLYALAAMSVVACSARIWWSSDAASVVRHAHSLPFHLDWFALGMLLAVASAWNDVGGRLPSAVRGLANREWACGLLAAAGFAGVALTGWTAHGGPQLSLRSAVLLHWSFQGMSAMLVVLPAALGDRDQRVQRWLRRPWPSSLGTISYGIYLWHWIVIMAIIPYLDHAHNLVSLMVQALIVFVAAASIATVSHRVVERPAIRLAADLTAPVVHFPARRWRESTG